MILTAHQPAYLPWLGLFHKIALSDVYIFMDTVQFEKNSFINRNKIKTPDGIKWITVPVSLSGYTKKNICDMEISSNNNWERNHWLNLYSSYKRAPFFSVYADFFEELYKQKWTNLVDLSMYMLKFFLSELNIKTKVIKQSELDTKEKKQELIIEMCKKLDADIFVFGALGKDYAKEEDFNNKKIQIYFQDYKHPSYTQLWGKFEPYLSIVDLLFNKGSSRAFEIIMEDNINKEDLHKLLLK